MWVSGEVEQTLAALCVVVEGQTVKQEALLATSELGGHPEVPRRGGPQGQRGALAEVLVADTAGWGSGWSDGVVVVETGVSGNTHCNHAVTTKTHGSPTRISRAALAPSMLFLANLHYSTFITAKKIMTK